LGGRGGCTGGRCIHTGTISVTIGVTMTGSLARGV
jgi:hypothetical protein